MRSKRDSRDAYFDKKTRSYFNHKFWNLDNVMGEEARTSELDFIQLLSCPHSPSELKSWPKVSKTLRNCIKQDNDLIVTHDTVKYPPQQGKDESEAPSFTIRLSQKEIVQNPLSSRPSVSTSGLKSRPESAAFPPKISSGSETPKNHGAQPVLASSCIRRPRSSPHPGRVCGSDNEVFTKESLDILNSYAKLVENAQVVSRHHCQHTITPSSFVCSLVDEAKPKMWVEHKSENTQNTKSEFSIFQRFESNKEIITHSCGSLGSTHEDGEAKEKESSHTKKVPEHTDLTRARCTPCIHRGSNWSKTAQGRKRQDKKKIHALPATYTPVKVRAPGELAPCQVSRYWASSSVPVPVPVRGEQERNNVANSKFSIELPACPRDMTATFPPNQLTVAKVETRRNR